MPPLIFRKGLELKHEVAQVLAQSYNSSLVSKIKENNFQFTEGRLTVHLAEEFGFCYGVDRAVDYAYQAHKRFPDRQIFLTGEIIHNPHVNKQLRNHGIRFLSDQNENIHTLTPKDVVIIPAFGVTIQTLALLGNKGCTLVDTTCGSVLNVWKNVKRYAEEGYTSVIHGKYWHEETQATAAQALKASAGHYLIVLDQNEASIVCDYICHGGATSKFLDRFSKAVSPGFDPRRDLVRLGCANQTTMLSSESLKIGEMFREAIATRYGETSLTSQFLAFDTICSATQDRQDAVTSLLDKTHLNLMIVIGGYNSSNTCNLALLCTEKVDTYHIAEPACLVSTNAIKHKPVGSKEEITSQAWLPHVGKIQIGLTSGASTPDNLVEATLNQLSRLANKGT